MRRLSKKGQGSADVTVVDNARVYRELFVQQFTQFRESVKRHRRK
jgi:hypothetical protein